MNIEEATKLTITSLKADPALPLLWVGASGIGKTTCAKAVAEALNKPFIFVPVRAEDPLGLNLPDKTYSKLRFVPHAHFQRAINEPCLLYIDELNRANLLTRNSIMELLGDTAQRTCGGHMLHPETSILISQNDESDCYDVFESDAASKGRIVAIPVHPDPELGKQYALQRGFTRMAAWIEVHGNKLKRELSWKISPDLRFLCMLERLFISASKEHRNLCDEVASFCLGPSAKAFISSVVAPPAPKTTNLLNLEATFKGIAGKYANT